MYGLVVEDCVSSDDCSFSMYGIKYICRNGNEILFRNLTSQKDELENLINICISTNVTEISLSDIIYDFISAF